MYLSIGSLFIILFLTTYQVQSNTLLNNFNNLFLGTYKKASTYFLTTIDPLIITNADTLTLKHRGQHTSININRQLYHNLKTIAHIPLTIYLSVFNVEANSRNFSSDELIKLKSYLRELRFVRKSLNISDFSSNNEMFQIQFDIIDLSITFLRSLIRSKQLNITALNKFCHKATNLFNINIKHATRAHLDRLHSVIYPIYTKLFNETEQKTVQVLIIGSKPPREGFLIKQYFQKLLGGNNVEGKRLLYAENAADEQGALNILGRWLLDANAAQAFFDDETRLHRDLLMDEASIYIKALFE
ncbi:unnamed protein product [Rotaria sp. Silwood1]|nr:unnamed protein product [Rotaria sp. Silwood1]CAF3554173.1 unnamed protein product [Rotaria sp. Silwood1]